MTDIKALKKVELHCHLDGSLSLEAIRHLADLAQISLPENDDDLKELVTAPEETDSLAQYLKAFDSIRPLLQTKEALKYAAYDVTRQAAEENVIYIEIRFAPELSMDKGLTALETVEAVLEGLADAENDFNITARALVCGMKHTPIEETLAIFKEVHELAGRGLAGFDFAGDEARYPTELYREACERIQATGIPFTFHAGECGHATNIEHAIQQGAKRIGHATAIVQQPDLIEEMKANNVTAEICLISNLQTKAAQSIQEFPYPLLRQNNVPVAISTDNRTVSQTNLTREYENYVKYFNLTVQDFHRHNKEALSAAFIDDSLKEKLTHELDHYYENL